MAQLLHAVVKLLPYVTAATARICLCRSHRLVLVCRRVSGCHGNLVLGGIKGLPLVAVCRVSCVAVCVADHRSPPNFPPPRQRTILRTLQNPRNGSQFPKSRRADGDLDSLLDIGSIFVVCVEKRRPACCRHAIQADPLVRRLGTGFSRED